MVLFPSARLVNILFLESEWAMSQIIAHEAKNRMGSWLIGYEGERNNCFSKTQLVGQKNIKTKHLSQVKAGHQSFFTAKTLKIWQALFATSGWEHIAY